MRMTRQSTRLQTAAISVNVPSKNDNCVVQIDRTDFAETNNDSERSRSNILVQIKKDVNDNVINVEICDHLTESELENRDEYGIGIDTVYDDSKKLGDSLSSGELGVASGINDESVDSSDNDWEEVVMEDLEDIHNISVLPVLKFEMGELTPAVLANTNPDPVIQHEENEVSIPIIHPNGVSSVVETKILELENNSAPTAMIEVIGRKRQEKDEGKLNKNSTAEKSFFGRVVSEIDQGLQYTNNPDKVDISDWLEEYCQNRIEGSDGEETCVDTLIHCHQSKGATLLERRVGHQGIWVPMSELSSAKTYAGEKEACYVEPLAQVISSQDPESDVTEEVLTRKRKSHEAGDFMPFKTIDKEKDDEKVSSSISDEYSISKLCKLRVLETATGYKKNILGNEETTGHFQSMREKLKLSPWVSITRVTVSGCGCTSMEEERARKTMRMNKPAPLENMEHKLQGEDDSCEWNENVKRREISKHIQKVGSNSSGKGRGNGRQNKNETPGKVRGKRSLLKRSTCSSRVGEGIDIQNPELSFLQRNKEDRAEMHPSKESSEKMTGIRQKCSRTRALPILNSPGKTFSRFSQLTSSQGTALPRPACLMAREKIRGFTRIYSDGMLLDNKGLRNPIVMGPIIGSPSTRMEGGSLSCEISRKPSGVVQPLPGWRQIRDTHRASLSRSRENN